MRHYLLILLGCFFTFSLQAQKIVLYTKLDSLKAAQKASLQSIKARNLPDKVIDSIEDRYKDLRDSVRELAHDCADSIIEHMDVYSHFELGVDVASNQYYYSRRGPAAGAVGTPAFKYKNKTGFYAMFNTNIYNIKYALIKPTRQLNKVDTIAGQKTVPDVTITAGFERTFFDKWDVELYYDHTFINYGSDKNLLANTLDINTGFDFWNYITAKVEYQFLFGGAANDPLKKKLSNILSFYLYKDFKIYRLPGSAVLSIGPELMSNVGNDNLARSRVIARNRHGGENVPELYDNFFGLLDIEAGVNISYRIKNLEISLSPIVGIPFNQIPPALPPNITNASQLAQFRQNQMQPPVFYATAGIKYFFKFWKEKHWRH
jgi:hypothetical protein